MTAALGSLPLRAGTRPAPTPARAAPWGRPCGNSRVSRLTAHLLLLTVLPAAATAQARLNGAVVEDSSGRALAGVEIEVQGTGRTGVTNAFGHYHIDSIPVGWHLVLFRYVGYQPVRQRVNLRDGATSRSDALLVPFAATLDSVVVTGSSKKPRGIGLEGFEERRALGFGRFIDSTTLRNATIMRLTDLLRRNGVEVRRVWVPERSRFEEWAVSRRVRGPSGAPCPMQVFLDGMAIYKSRSPGQIPPDMRTLFDVSALEAVEIYRGPAETPLEFGGPGADCETIVLWSRRSTGK